jgi:hypothetical protein
MTLPTYIQGQTSETFDLWNLIGYGQSITNTYPQKQEKDALSFMEVFTFPKIEVLKKSLVETKKFTADQISEIIAGLGDLPQYQGDKC